MSKKIVISKPGFDVIKTTDPDNLIFSSDYGTLRYAKTMSFSLAYNDGPATYTQYDRGVTDSFGFGYYPIIFGFVDKTSSGIWIPLPDRSQTIGAYHSFWFFYSRNVILTIISQYASGGGGSDRTALFKYFIFKNDLGI